ncbi:NepR family anti-sigma factor [Nitrospirillum sp. BR 11163]|uniref:NepR family anti-sigma factor n=1 Tax=Nitrospirillum sp. BR 11163 TaxID=3104323 RepID=UPI002AFE3F0F|nr:NepR family anti-sigma factor [Nitrospirillum sp. BR 11163]MEA1673551.1 NepR family anti-sigma factor [Nitrospirillum sp. BR 11163]
MTKQPKPTNGKRSLLTAGTRPMPPGPHTVLDRGLREMFEDEEAEPVPQHLLDLVDKLHQKSRKH